MSANAQLHILGAVRHRAGGRLRLIRRAALAALAQAQPSNACEWSIRLSDDAEVRELNRAYRKLDKPTDVLSFGGENYRDGVRLLPTSDLDYLGDVVISMERCAAQAAKGGHALEHELALLVIHGTLHLLGYDHDTRARKAVMWQAQARALSALGIALRVR